MASSLKNSYFFVFPLVLQKLIWIPTRIILTLFGRIQISGLENLRDVSESVIFACNHMSELDPILIPGSLPFWSRFSPIFYTSREKAFYDTSGWRGRFYGGLFFKAWGAYPVFVGLHDYEKSLMYHIRIVKAGGSMCVFPEGSISNDGTVKSGKAGVAYLAYVTGKPIIPVKLEGAWGMRTSEFFLRKRVLRVTYGKPMYVTSKEIPTFSFIELKSYANQVMDEIRRMGSKNTLVFSVTEKTESETAKVGAPV